MQAYIKVTNMITRKSTCFWKYFWYGTRTSVTKYNFSRPLSNYLNVHQTPIMEQRLTATHVWQANTVNQNQSVHKITMDIKIRYVIYLHLTVIGACLNREFVKTMPIRIIRTSHTLHRQLLHRQLLHRQFYRSFISLQHLLCPIAISVSTATFCFRSHHEGWINIIVSWKLPSMVSVVLFVLVLISFHYPLIFLAVFDNLLHLIDRQFARSTAADFDCISLNKV